VQRRRRRAAEREEAVARAGGAACWGQRRQGARRLGRRQRRRRRARGQALTIPAPLVLVPSRWMDGRRGAAITEMGVGLCLCAPVVGVRAGSSTDGAGDMRNSEPTTCVEKERVARHVPLSQTHQRAGGQPRRHELVPFSTYATLHLTLVLLSEAGALLRSPAPLPLLAQWHRLADEPLTGEVTIGTCPRPVVRPGRVLLGGVEPNVPLGEGRDAAHDAAWASGECVCGKIGAIQTGMFAAAPPPGGATHAARHVRRARFI
jgi:hypothetical protein